jgi:hypothetical protein
MMGVSVRKVASLMAVVGLGMPACSDDGDEDESYEHQCTVAGRTGSCDPFEAPDACLSDTVLCRCAILIDADELEGRYLELDCDEDCRDRGYSEGICTELVVSTELAGNHTCGCRGSESMCRDGTVISCEPLCRGERVCVDGEWEGECYDCGGGAGGATGGDPSGGSSA